MSAQLVAQSQMQVNVVIRSLSLLVWDQRLTNKNIHSQDGFAKNEIILPWIEFPPGENKYASMYILKLKRPYIAMNGAEVS